MRVLICESKFFPRLSHEHVGSHHGQDDFVIRAHHPETMDEIGRLTYSDYRGKAHIQHIEVDPKHRRKGVGVRLYRYLHKFYKPSEVRPGLATSSGHKMIKSYHRRYPDG